jgi:hypothetical protein
MIYGTQIVDQLVKLEKVYLHRKNSLLVGAMKAPTERGTKK